MTSLIKNELKQIESLPTKCDEWFDVQKLIILVNNHYPKDTKTLENYYLVEQKKFLIALKTDYFQ